MGKLHSLRISVTLYLLIHLLRCSSLSLLSSTYTLPDDYFINCGSDSDVSLSGLKKGRNFIGDGKRSRSFGFNGQSSTVADTNSPTSSVYQTARIFNNPSSYELKTIANGTYMVRLHFCAFASPSTNLSHAQFDVLATGYPKNGFSLLSNFSVKNTNSCSSPVIKEFLLYIAVGKFVIYFLPSNDSHIAFVNAIEVFLSPESFVPGSATLVNATGGNSTFKGLLSNVLRTTVYRINVGGDRLTYVNDTMGRTWVPDDAFLITPNYLAQNTPFYNFMPNYYNGGATEYDAPDLVYQTAKEINMNTFGGSNFSMITWRFNVSRNASHFVRVHFCDIISISQNTLWFSLYVNGKFREIVNPFSINPQGAAPFLSDFVVESDNSGFIHIALGPGDYPLNTTALLNGLEIMEITNGSVSLPVIPTIKQPGHLLAIVGFVIGGVAFLLLLIGVFVLIWKRRKAKPAETLGWSSRTGTTERTVNGSIVGNLNLGLKLSFLHIQSATNNFDMKLMIGKGGFGRVYKGTLPNGMKVAVKRSDPENGQGLPEFQTEIMVLSKIRHRHLVSLIGYCDERSEMILVYEFMEKGTLRDHLYNWKGDTETLSSVSELSWNRRLEICIGAAKGLHYLHDQGIIHRDIKSTNILLDENYVAKVADFGISRLGVLDQTHVSMEVKGSFGYFDPEYFRDFQLTQKSDVYSFGVVLLEVLCARAAINTSLPTEQVNLADWGLAWLRKGQLEKIVDPLLVGKINPNSLRKFGETMEKCLRESGVDRPNMHDVRWDLEYVLRLQQNARHREPHEDSTTAGASWMLRVPAVQQLASESISIDGYDMPMSDFSDSTPNSLEVFSLLKVDNAR